MASDASAAGGLLIVDKPRGVTSFDVVAAVRGALRTKKVGHAGTLDPMATGVLVIGFGHATRLLTAIVEHDKTYEATIRLGLATTTDDAEGAIVPQDEGNREESGAASLDMRNLERAIATIEQTIRAHFLGDISQVPNAYSAIKINGKRAYDLARAGKDVELKARPVTISEFAVLDARAGQASAATPGLALGERGAEEPQDAPMADVIDVDVRVSCSSGTYIRALARDLGAELGCGGHLIRLRRTRVGRFALSAIQPITAHTESKTFTDREGNVVTRNKCVLDIPAELTDREARTDWLRSRALDMFDAAAGALPVIPVSDEEAAELRFGRRINRQWLDDVSRETPVAACVLATRDVVALVASAGAKQLKPVTVFATA